SRRRHTRWPRDLSSDVCSSDLIAVVQADGAILTDADGNRLIDFGGGIGVVNTGHRHAGVVRAVREQLDRFAHVCFPVSTYEPYRSEERRVGKEWRSWWSP